MSKERNGLIFPKKESGFCAGVICEACAHVKKLDEVKKPLKMALKRNSKVSERQNQRGAQGSDPYL